MKSIKLKFIILILGCVIISSTIIGIASIRNSQEVVDRDSTEILNLLAKNKSDQINHLLNSIETSVETLADFARNQLVDLEHFKSDQDFFDNYLYNITEVALNAAKNTSGALTVYMRFNPNLWGPTAGFFYQHDKFSNRYLEVPTTDLSLYHKDDSNRVGWYYSTLEAKEGIWINPYNNENINEKLVSYCVPIFNNQEFIGLVGMDINYSLLQDIVDHSTVYDTGYTFLTDQDALIIEHKSLTQNTDLKTYDHGRYTYLSDEIKSSSLNENTLIEYTFDGISKKATIKTLNNNMRLIVTVPKQEIDAQANALYFHIIMTMFIIISIVVTISLIFIKRLVTPLLELTEAAKKIANGDLNVSITHHSKDEIGTLAESFRQTILHLDKYFSHINDLAYKDPLTGVKNKTAYLQLKESIENNQTHSPYAIAVFDINALKPINDHYGHHAGDLLIIKSCEIICQVFVNIPIYRIGGDEFAVILNKEHLPSLQELLDEFDDCVCKFNKSNITNIDISIARGTAIFDSQIDSHFNDVFNRADKAMYSHKATLKKQDN